MNKLDRILSETYKINESTNLFTIEIALNRYENIFSKWDSSPFKRREIDPELEEYLARCSDEIPFQYTIELDFTLLEEIKNRQKEEQSQEGFKNHFTYKMYLF